MTDNELIQLFLPIINAGLTAQGYTDVIVKQNYDATMQGIPSGPTVYFFKVGDHRHGCVGRKNVWDEINDVMIYTETQVYETTFQVSALVTQDPTNISYTASDLVNVVASIMQSYTTIQSLVAEGVGILRITDVRNPYFVDDRDRFEASPSFDFTLTYNRDIVTQSPVISEIDYLIESI